MNKILTSITIALFALVTHVNAASLITNGSFETGDDPGSFAQLLSGAPDIVDWDIFTGNLDYIGSLWIASDGTRSIDLNGFAAGGIGQTFDTSTGTEYKVTFDLAGNTGDAPAIKTLEISADGQSQEFSFDTTGLDFNNMGWTSLMWTFIADDSSATLQFLSLTGGVRGPALDNVSVNAVPLPAAMWLFGSGILGLFVNSRTRKSHS